jgi:hypothetical protein
VPRVGFESTIPVFELAKTIHALGRAATVIGLCTIYTNYINYTEHLSMNPYVCVIQPHLHLTLWQHSPPDSVQSTCYLQNLFLSDLF